MDVRRVGARLHQDALLDERVGGVGDRVRPHRRRAVQGEALAGTVALRIGEAADAVGAEPLAALGDGAQKWDDSPIPAADAGLLRWPAPFHGGVLMGDGLASTTQQKGHRRRPR